MIYLLFFFRLDINFRMVSIPDCLARINAVLQLLGQLENSGPPPASKQAINLLPILTIQQDDIGKLFIFNFIDLLTGRCFALCFYFRKIT